MTGGGGMVCSEGTAISGDPSLGVQVQINYWGKIQVNPAPSEVHKAARTRELAGQEGIEPPTCGFGDRRSAN